MKKIYYPVLILILFFLAGACKKIEQLPDIPYIEYTSFAVFDTTDILGNNAKGGRLKFTFQDGDGDLGLEAPSEEQTDTTNLFFSLFRKTDGVMEPAPGNDPLKPSSYRIPYMDREGQNKILKGTITITFLYMLYSESDTIRYDFYIKDRAGNESNIASTSEISIFTNNSY